MTPQQQAQEWAEKQIADIPDRHIEMERQDWLDNEAETWLAGHAAGVQENLIISKSEIIQAERGRIWAEIQSKLEMCADSWRIGELDLERIIFGEQP